MGEEKCGEENKFWMWLYFREVIVCLGEKVEV